VDMGTVQYWWCRESEDIQSELDHNLLLRRGWTLLDGGQIPCSPPTCVATYAPSQWTGGAVEVTVICDRPVTFL
jgi:hypothetical protein